MLWSQPMNKIKNILLIAATTGVVFLIPLFLAHDSPIEITIPQLDGQELAAKKEATEQAEKQAAKQAQREALLRRIYACQEDEDCIIVDKDPCGCAVGPAGVVAVNVNLITEFNAINSNQVTKACPDTVSTEKECGESAQAVCRARTCKIIY